MSEPAGKRILVIDDDPAILHLIRDALEPHGYQLVLVSDPLEAFKDCSPGDFDLILTDYDMKPLKGDVLAFLAQVSEESDPASPGSMPPVIVVTGYGDHVRVSEWAKWQAVRKVLDKPFDLDVLRAAVKEVLAEPGSRE